MASSSVAITQSKLSFFRSAETTWSPMLICRGTRSDLKPTSVFAIAMRRERVLPKGSQDAATLNHVNSEGMTISPKGHDDGNQGATRAAQVRA